jgi:NADP-dependent aldehyde dehydrogenase
VAHLRHAHGPPPASTQPSTAIDRFLRPVSYQDLPGWLLPEALQDANPLGLHRIRDGELVKG